MLNPSPAPVYSNQQVGTLQPFDEPSACALQLSENCNKINPGAEEAVQQMMAQVEDLSTSERERLHSLIRYFGKMRSSTKLILEMLHQSASLHEKSYQSENESPRLIQEMLSRNIIEPAHGPWLSPVVLVKKRMDPPDFVWIAAKYTR